MHVEVPAVPVKELIGEPAGEPSAAIRDRVNAARAVQRSRFQGMPGLYCNAQMGSREVKRFCRLDGPSADLLNQSISRLGLSARAYHRVLKIARTIADLDGAASPRINHLAEAIRYRSLDRGMA